MWWLVYVYNAAGKTTTFHVVHGSPPAAGSSYAGGIVNSVRGPYSTSALAQQAVGSSTGTTGSVPGLANPSGTAFQPPPLTGLLAIGDFFQRLAEKSTWIRVGEFAAGALLLTAGVIALTKNTPVGKAAKSAGKTFNKVATKGVL